MQASNVTIGLARSRQRERQAAASFQAITMASAGLVLDEDFDVIHAIDPRNDDDKSDEEDFERASDEAAADGGCLARVTSVFVHYPRRVVLAVLLTTVAAMYATYLDGFALSTESPYDWECPDDEYTKLRDAMAAAADEADESPALQERGDYTYPFYFFYDAKPWNRPASCEAPFGIFTPQSLQAMCQAEAVLTSNTEFREDYCVLVNNTCLTRVASVLQFFYNGSTCELLDEDRIAEGWALLQTRKEVFYVDKDAFARGYACKARSIVYVGTPLEGYAETSRLGDAQARDMQEQLGTVMETALWKYYDMTGHTLNSKYNQAVRSAGHSVLWFSEAVAQLEFARLVNEDFLVAFASVLFVWGYLIVHLGSIFVGSMAMLQISVSLPLSLFFYRVVFRISYFASMQILVVFVILGIGADDCFVFSDAWKQSIGEPDTHRRLQYAYARALQSMANTSLTTAAAFLATAISPIMPIAAFGIYAAICVLMNYALAMTMLPAVLIWQGQGSKCCNNDVALVEGGPCVEGYLKVLSWRNKLVAKLLVLTLGGLSCTAAYLASKLEPPTEPEAWFAQKHMFQQVADLLGGGSGGGAYGTNEDQSYDSFHVVFGITKVKRDGFDPYAPAKRRASPDYAGGFDLYAAQDAFLEACDLVEGFESGMGHLGVLVRPNTTLCFLREFRSWQVGTYGDQAANKSTFDTRLVVFRDTTAPANPLHGAWKAPIGIVNGELKYVRIDGRVSMTQGAAINERKRTLRRAQKLLRAIRRLDAPSLRADRAFQVSGAWIWYETQVALVRGLTTGISIGFPVAFLVLTAATRNVILSLYAIIVIGCVVSGVLGLCYTLGWSLGIRESVAGVIVIGLAVDYTIHLGHMYDHARFHAGLDTRDERTAYALRKMGRTVFAGAVTTAGAASLMFACQLTFFVQMACLIVFTIALSITLALGLYVPMLHVMGPEREQGNLWYLWRRCFPSQEKYASETRAASWRLDPIATTPAPRALARPPTCAEA